LLLLANRSERILLIKWQRVPYLEDFLQPPINGLDWRLPEGMNIGDMPYMPWDNWHKKSKEEMDSWNKFYSQEHIYKKRNLIIYTNNEFYDAFKKEFFITKSRPHGTFGEIMKLLFEPTPGLSESIKKTMKQLQLVPNQFVSAHYRSKDIRKISSEASLIPKDLNILKEIDNSINCALFKIGNNSMPVYFTSSNSMNVEYVLHKSPFANKNSSVHVVGVGEYFRFHLNHRTKFYNPIDYYPVFVDL